MASLTIAVWFITLLLALPLGAGLLQGRMSLGGQALAVSGGFALLIVYVSVGEPAELAWVASFLGALGVLALSVGAVGLVRDEKPVLTATNQRTNEHEALLAGVELPLLIAAALLAVLAALGIGTAS
jgi:hypothetical protein